ncbi:MAG TPA: NUDIX hydrolase [Ktedonobacteraceae bacterium]|jgi:ADP-ribose pyrophosphatase YjhB (NUDIX family)
MFTSLPHDIQDELRQLARRYGQPLTDTIELASARRFEPLNKTDRYGEVCMVIRRPNGHLLTMTKTTYPPNAYRLPTGGINHVESVIDALLRETQEETGLHVNVERFLAAAAYRIPGQDYPSFYTFAFLLDEVGGTLQVIDEEEQIEDFREFPPEALLAVAQNLEQVTANYSKQIDGYWRDWGRFRAIIHRLAWEALHT